MKLNSVEPTRCVWAGTDPVYCAYHDTEWGRPVHNDTKLFEMLILEGFQAGLSWITILKRRAYFTEAFDNWDYRKIARYSNSDINRLLENNGIIRNRLKINATIKNARHFMEIQKEFGSFDTYLWRFTNNTPIVPKRPYRTLKDVPCSTPISDALSIDLKKRGFTFVGSVICYSFMQAIGMACDHTRDCFLAHRS